jgi:tetratricopeptide (TPR) repeat protein
MPRSILQAVRGVLAVPRFRYLVAAGAVLFAGAALLPWSQAPSGLQSYVGSKGELVLVEEAHWTQIVARLATLVLAAWFLHIGTRRTLPGPGTLRMAWALIAFLLVFPAWQNQWAPQERMDKQLLFGQMNRVIDEMERSSVEQQRQWRDWQDFSGQSLPVIHGVQAPDETVGFVLFSPNQWFRLLEDLLGLSREFLGFFRPILLAGLMAAATFVLLGLHLGSGLGVAGFRRGLVWGVVCYVGFLAGAVVPRVIAEYLLLQSEQAAREGETEQALAKLRAAGSWRPALNLSWSHHRQLGQLIQLKNRDLSAEPYLAEAFTSLQTFQAVPALQALIRAQMLAPEDPAVRTFLGVGLCEAGIDAFNNGQYSLAGEYWEESLAYVAINPTPWYGLSLVNFRLRRWDDAARCLGQVVRLQRYLGTQRWTAGSQAAVAASWAAFHNGDLKQSHALYTWSLTPEQW